MFKYEVESLEVLLIALDAVLLGKLGRMGVQTRLQSPRHKRVNAFVISIPPGESERKASSGLDLLRDSVERRPKAEEPAAGNSLGETVVHG